MKQAYNIQTYKPRIEKKRQSLMSFIHSYIQCIVCILTLKVIKMDNFFSYLCL